MARKIHLVLISLFLICPAISVPAKAGSSMPTVFMYTTMVLDNTSFNGGAVTTASPISQFNTTDTGGPGLISCQFNQLGIGGKSRLYGAANIVVLSTFLKSNIDIYKTVTERVLADLGNVFGACSDNVNIWWN